MIVDCCSDLHGFYPEMDGGDLLIIAGDLTARDDFMGWQQFATWAARQKYRMKIFIAGNHDNFLYEAHLMKMPLVGPQDLADVHFLCDDGIEFEYLDIGEDGVTIVRRVLKIWGSPWTKSFPGMNPNCKAFTVDTEDELLNKFKIIPTDVDILITHSPPWGILDEIYDEDHCSSFSVGSKTLSDTVYTSATFLNLKLHVFGHIHEAYGIHQDDDGPIMVNASHVNEFYKPVNKPIRIIL